MKPLLILVWCLLALVLADEADDFVTGARIFSADVYNEVLLNNKDNIIVSPFSADTILALAQSGAVGATGNELRTALHLPSTKEETETDFKSVLSKIHGDEYVLKTANKIFVENNYPIKNEFKSVATDVYGASFENVEFAESVEAAAEINQWVSNQTNNRINDIIQPDSLNNETRVVLVNALYFQGNWSYPFDNTLTTKSAFHTSENQSVDASLMYSKSLATSYYESEELDAQIIELPFEGNTVTMTLILPNKKEGIAILEKHMDLVFEDHAYTSEHVEVFLPKFKIETTTDFKEILLGLGVETPFSPRLADFSGIAGVQGSLFIGDILQKAYIDVNELGVEAAAATEIDIPTAVRPPSTRTFNADHPFVFYIKTNDIVLFEGRVLVPEYSD